jgi:hypothetical protein
MFPSLARANLLRNQYKLFFNQLKLISEQTVTSMEMIDDGEGNMVSSGTPIITKTFVTHWEGKGSIQYVRPRIQKAIASENQGTIEDAISLVAYIPYESSPIESMMLIDVDGAAGNPGRAYAQTRRPANVGGLDVYWELYLGLGANG